MPHLHSLKPSETALVVVDVQEAFRSSINDFVPIASRISTIVRGFQILDLPIIITEQYPKGLGRTAEEILFSLPPDHEFIEKTAFSSCGASSFLEKLKSANASQIVLCGLETHVCINQTAHDLLSEKYQVHLLEDCVGSRFTPDKEIALKKMQMSGVIPSSVEMVLFELMKDAKNEHFKQIQELIK
ncbi:MAG: hydrolase [Acidobacteriota bacterium]|nr:hydrolase [Acidobacteriota bacterium]